VRQEPKYLKVKFTLGSITLVVGLIGASIALFQWVERTGIQHLFGDYSRYVLGFGGFAAMIFGAMLINDAWVLGEVSRGKYKVPTSYMTTKTATIYEEVKSPTKTHHKFETTRHPAVYKQSFIKNILEMHEFNEENKLVKFFKKLGRRKP